MFKQKSLTAILATFTKVQQDLVNFIDHHDNHFSDKTDLVSELTSEIEVHNQEKASAAKVLENIQKLVGSDSSQTAAV